MTKRRWCDSATKSGIFFRPALLVEGTAAVPSSIGEDVFGPVTVGLFVLAGWRPDWARQIQLSDSSDTRIKWGRFLPIVFYSPFVHVTPRVRRCELCHRRCSRGQRNFLSVGQNFPGPLHPRRRFS